MPNIRRAVERGDWIFIISGKVPGVQQYVTGGMEVDEKIGVLAAYERFPENRLSLDDNGRVVGNIIVQPDGSQHPLDTHPAESFSARIENYIVGCDPLALTTPREFETGRRQTLDRLAEILDRPKANRVIDIVSRWRRLNADSTERWARRR